MKACRRVSSLVIFLLGSVFGLLGTVGVDAADGIEIIEAVKSGDLTAVRSALERSDPNATDVDGTTALHWAAHLSHAELVNLLIDSGAKVNAKNRYQVSAASLAATNGNALILDKLLGAGADPNDKAYGGETLLMAASRAGNVEAVDTLLRHGADVDAREETRGQTALMWAAAQGNSEVVGVLLSAGADVNARAAGPGSIRDAKPDANTSSLLLFLGVRAPRLDTFTPLMFAARNGHLDAARVLVEAGAGVNEAVADTSVLEIAIANAAYELAAFLVDEGADPAFSANGWTPLHRLARTRKPNLGYIPGIIGADDPGGLELARKLIEKGADVNARQTAPVDDSYRQTERLGATPFWLAAKYVDVELMRVLLDAGADPLISIEDGTTPLMAAAGMHMLYLSEDTGTEEDTVEAVRLCVESGADLNGTNEDGNTPLHGAARRGVNGVVEFLVENGAKLDARNSRDLTPLLVAEGAQRGDRQPHTALLMRELMLARNMEIVEIDREILNPLKTPGSIRELQQERPGQEEQPGSKPASSATIGQPESTPAQATDPLRQ